MVKFLEGADEFSINESKYGLITSTISGNMWEAQKKDLLLYRGGYFKQKSGVWYLCEDFIKDGRLVNIQKAFKMYKGKMRCVLQFKDSITADKEGRVKRRIICRIPILDIKIKKEIWALVYLTTHRKNCESCPSQETIS